MKAAALLTALCCSGAVVAQLGDLPLAAPTTWAGVLALGLWVLSLELRQRHERHLAGLRHQVEMARITHLADRESEDREQIAVNGRAVTSAKSLAEGLYLERAATVPDLAEVMRRAEEDRRV